MKNRLMSVAMLTGSMFVGSSAFAGMMGGMGMMGGGMSGGMGMSGVAMNGANTGAVMNTSVVNVRRAGMMGFGVVNTTANTTTQGAMNGGAMGMMGGSGGVMGNRGAMGR